MQEDVQGDLHLCCACSLWIHSHIAPHPQHRFWHGAACIESKRKGAFITLPKYSHTFPAVILEISVHGSYL